MDSNITLNNTAASVQTEDMLKAPWLVGIGVCAVCMSLQLLLLALVPGARKYDQLVLAQLTAARAANTASEYCIVTGVGLSAALTDAVYVACLSTDFALVCWMFVFSKNLYDKVVLVFAARRCPLSVVSALVWALSVPVGALCLVLLKLNTDYFLAFYRTYASVKLAIVAVNALLFVEIFRVAFRRGLASPRDLGELVKSAAVASALVCLTSAQVLVTDLLSLAWPDLQRLAHSFCVVNAFQPVLVTAIFVIITKSQLRESIAKTLSLKLSEVRTL